MRHTSYMGLARHDLAILRYVRFAHVVIATVNAMRLPAIYRP
jgi:hypothetical protein